MKKANIKILVVAILILGLISCNDDEVQNNNTLEATLVFFPGATVRINASGPDVMMGCPAIGGTFVSASNSTGETLSLTPGVPNPFECIVNPGTFYVSCQYQKSSQGAVYSNYHSDRPASITFTKLTDHNMEGFFTAILKCYSAPCDADSLIVTGSFKGDNIL